MTLKLLNPTEIKQANESARARDIARTESAKKALDSVQLQLNDVNLRFEKTMADHKVTWAKAEEAALVRISELEKEIESLEYKKKQACIPIDDLKKKSYDLFTQAEQVLQNANAEKAKADSVRRDAEDLSERLQSKLDSASEKLEEISRREKSLALRERTALEERNQIKDLAEELSIKLSQL